MGEVNKLLIELDGKKMVRHVAESVLASAAAPVIAVLGHERDPVRAALHVHRVVRDRGPSASLRRGGTLSAWGRVA